MGQVLVTESYLQDIADAIRAKYGNSTKYTPSSMASAILSIPGGGATINNQATTVTPTETQQAITYSSGYTGLSTVTVKGIPSTYVGSGVTTKGATTITPTTSAQTAVNSSVYTTGVIKVAAIPSCYVLPSGTMSITTNGTKDVKSYAAVDVNVSGGGVNNQTKSVDPTESQQLVTYDSGYTGLSTVTVTGIPSTFVGSGVARKDSSNVSLSGSTFTAPAGYYSVAATKAMSSGTAGTPTATKGSVSSNSITVTPSVTNVTGYITGGTKTGTAISVSASQLVAGTASISSNGVTDVTNYKAVDVNVAGGGGVAAVAGTFKTQTTTGATQSITIPYTGSGYPVAAMVWIKGGAYN